jgi:predicted TPR repeat methyltransferase
MTSDSTPASDPPAPSADLPIAARLAATVRMHQQGQVEAAAESYRSILQSQPNHADVLHFLGIAEHQLGDSEKALAYIDRAVALAPAHPDLRNNRGNILKELGRLDEAEADYRRALELCPGDPSALNNLGTVVRRRGDLEGAVAIFRQAIAAHLGHAEAWQNLGTTLGDLGRQGEAVEILWEALRLAPQDVDSYRALGAMLCAANRVDKAIEVYHRWIELFPDDPRPRHYLAACTSQSVPSRAPDDYVRKTFDVFAETFDSVLGTLEYRAPTLIDQEAHRLLGPPRPTLDVLDAGCGTGLCGTFLKPRARRLVGVDLSAGMIEKARKRGLFDALEVHELTAFLRANENCFDLIVSADTLVYFGDLTDVVHAAAKALHPGGTLIFTLERTKPSDPPDAFRLNPHGRYSHADGYVRQVLERARLGVQAITEVTLRKEAGAWVGGWLVSAGALPAIA